MENDRETAARSHLPIIRVDSAFSVWSLAAQPAESPRRFAIAGAGDLARRVAERVFTSDSLCLRPIGYFADYVPVGTRPPQQEGVPALAVQGNLKALVQLAREPVLTRFLGRLRGVGGG